jgi:Tfp pilus assembly protein PilZ
MAQDDKFTWQPGDVQWIKPGGEDKADQGIRAAVPKKDNQAAIRKILRRGSSNGTASQ